MKKEITLTECLKELKTIDSRIAKKYSSAFIAVKQDATDSIVIPKTSFSEDEVVDSIKSEFQSVNDLIERKLALKSALVAANSKAHVTVGSQKMTIAEAIERKNAIPLQRQFLTVLKNQLMMGLKSLEGAEQLIESKFTESMKSLLDGKDSKTKEDDFSAIRKTLEDRFKQSLVDPLKLETVIAKLEEEIQEFEDNVDVALSIANSTTKVTV